MAKKYCPRCGMPADQWTGSNGQGITRGGLTYCCRGCAENVGCICAQEPKTLR